MKITEIARNSIKAHFNKENYFPGDRIEEKYKENKASFVTITKNNKLRGCMGSLEEAEPLWENVKRNAINAAFNDPRFKPLTETELKEIKIEISILSKPEPIKVKHSKFIPEKIKRNMGIILKLGNNEATFLPQVWDEIHDKIDFLEHLSKKAGLNKDEWKNANLFYYTIKKIIE